MTPTSEIPDPTRWYQLPVMWLVVLLPLLALVGGSLMVVLTTLKPDPEVYSERLDVQPPVDAPGG